MIDAEVARLRRLRDVALWTRALAHSLDGAGRRTSVFSRSARISWTIARAITGKLRAHPYLNYQQDASAVRAVMNGIGAGVLAVVAHQRCHALSTCAEHMQAMLRELDDARAVTWSPDLSDTFGRLQAQVRRLVAELQVSARHEMGANPATVDRVTKASGRAPLADWPYLAI